MCYRELWYPGFSPSRMPCAFGSDEVGWGGTRLRSGKSGEKKLLSWSVQGQGIGPTPLL